MTGWKALGIMMTRNTAISAMSRRGTPSKSGRTVKIKHFGRAMSTGNTSIDTTVSIDVGVAGLPVHIEVNPINMDEYYTDYFLDKGVLEDLIKYGADPYHDGKGVPLKAIKNGYGGTYWKGWETMEGEVGKELAQGLHELSKEYKSRFEPWLGYDCDDDDYLDWMNEEVTICGATAERWKHLFPEDPFGHFMHNQLLPSPKNWKK